MLFHLRDNYADKCINMPVTIEKLKELLELEEMDKEVIELGTYLYNLGKKEEGAKPTEDIRKLREDRHTFSS